MKLKTTTALTGILTGATLIAAGLPAMAETWNFTVIAGHPPLTKGVSAISTHFVPEVSKRVAELGHTIPANRRAGSGRKRRGRIWLCATVV